MAIKSSTINTKQLQVRGFGTRASAADVSASIKYAHLTYTVDGTETTGDTISFGQMVPGVVILPDLMKISTDGTGGTGAITKLGDNLDDDRYSATSVAVATASTVAVTPVNAQMVTPVGVPEGGETLTGVLTFATAITVGKKIVLRVPYLTVI